MAIKLEILAAKVRAHLRASAPVDTGNLRDNAIQVVQVSDKEMQVKVDGSIAPYAVYTNEKWVAPRWKGKENPNEKWIDGAVSEVVDILAHELGGKVDYDKQEWQDRWNNKNYWDSPEGQQKLKEYRTNDTDF